MIHALMYAPQPAIMAEMFPTRMRYSGVSLGYQVTSIVAGSLAPAIAVAARDFDTWVPIAIYLAAARGDHAGGCAVHARDERHRSGDRRRGRPRGARQGGRPMTELDGRTAWSPAARAGSARRARGNWRARGAWSPSQTSTTSAPRLSPRRSAERPGRWTFPTSRRWRSLQLEADILVNNAGVQHVSPIAEFPPERFRHLLALMVEAPFLLIRAALPHMYGQSFGRIINISSVHGIRASEFKVAYVTAKHGARGPVEGDCARGRRRTG